MATQRWASLLIVNSVRSTNNKARPFDSETQLETVGVSPNHETNEMCEERESLQSLFVLLLPSRSVSSEVGGKSSGKLMTSSSLRSQVVSVWVGGVN